MDICTRTPKFTVVDALAEFFEDMYTPKNRNEFDPEKFDMVDGTINQLRKNYIAAHDLLPGGLITTEEVQNVCQSVNW